jgi:hypothetical protein
MANITEYSRLLFKRSTAPGVIPTITTATTIDSSWLPTDILVGEGFVNVVDDRFWIRTNNGLVEFDLSGQTANRLTTGATLIGNTIYFETPESASAYTVDLSSIIVTGGTGGFSGYTYIQEDVSLQSLALSGSSTIIFDVEDFNYKNYTQRDSYLLNSQIEDKLNGDTINITQGFLEGGNGINLSSATTGGTLGNIAVTNFLIETRVTDGSDTSIISVQPNDIWIEGTGTFEGAKYDSDYSANFVNRSLVDKEYVDNSISGFSTFTGYTYIQEDTTAQTLVLSGAYNTIINTTDVSYRNNIDVQPPFTDSKVTNLDNNNTAQIFNGYGDDGIVINQTIKTQSDNSVTKSSVADELITLGVNRYDLELDTRIYLDRDMVEERVRNNNNGNIASVRLTATEKYQSIDDGGGNSTIKVAGKDNIQNQLFSDTEDRTIFHNIDTTSIRNIIYQASDGNNFYSNIKRLTSEETIITNSEYTIVQTTDASIPKNETRISQPNIDDTQSIRLQEVAYIYDETNDGINVASSTITVENIYHTVQGGEGQEDFIQINNDGVKISEVIGSSYTNFIVNNENGFYQSQFQSTGISKGVSKTNFRSVQTTDDTITSVVWPLSDLEIETGAIGVKATVTALNSDEDTAYVAELYAAVRINSYTPTIFGGVDKLEKTEFTTATSTIEIESSNLAIRVTGEAATTINWSVKYELIYSVPNV